MCFATGFVVKSRKNIFIITIIYTSHKQRIDDNDAVAGNNNACSFIWGICVVLMQSIHFIGPLKASLGSGAAAAAARKAVKTWAAWRQFGGGKAS